MKKSLVALLLLISLLGLYSCKSPEYIENQFYSSEVLKEGLVPDLPQPSGDFVYRTGTSAYCDKIYISSEESIEEYFSRILDYIEQNDYKFVGTVDWVKSTVGNLFLVDDSYTFKSTSDLLEPTANDYYNDDDKTAPYYSIIISHSDVQQGEYHEPYQHPEVEDIHWDGYYEYFFRGTLIRLCIDGYHKTLEYDDKAFEFDYYLEVRVNERIWMDYSYQPQN